MSDVSERWEMVVGLEVHCELRTKTKLFCGCPNLFGSEPNTQICPVCLGLPGSLPVLNKMAVDYAMAIGMALNCEVRPSLFHRKNYFYPDMPKDYQVSQYDEPINVGGWLQLHDGSKIGITRAHIEEDTGKSSHIGTSGRIHGADHSLIDYNRAGVPLVEIVSEPDIRTPTQARSYVSALRDILVATGASDGRMEEGSLRVDANVSMRRRGESEFGTRCEVKNLNSLRSLVRAIEFESSRQVGLLEDGKRVVQETRHWDEEAGRTETLRSKEEAYDYRYFPEPDLVLLDPSDEWKESIRNSLSIMPNERRARLAKATGVEESSELIATVVDQGLDDLVMGALGHGAPPKVALARASNDVATNKEGGKKLDQKAFASLCLMEDEGALSVAQVREVLSVLLEQGQGDPRQIAKDKGFEAMGADSIGVLIDRLIAENPLEWQRFLGGEEKLMGLFTGKVMRETGGKANGKVVAKELMKRKATIG